MSSAVPNRRPSPDTGQLPASWRWDPDRLLEADEPLTQPCPPWCGDTTGHPYWWGDAEGHPLVREHLRWFGNDVLIVAEVEAVAYDGPEVTRGPAGVRVHLEPDQVLDAAQALGLARSLQAAAADLGLIRHDPAGGPA